MNEFFMYTRERERERGRKRREREKNVKSGSDGLLQQFYDDDDDESFRDSIEEDGWGGARFDEWMVLGSDECGK
jgi:hypothetical protein